MQFDHEKATQSLNYLAKLNGGKINKMKAIKLIWLAERLHLRKYGRLILNDEYMAMEYGPVCSSTKDIAQLESTFLSAGEYKYASQYIKSDGQKLEITSINDPDTNVFSSSEVQTFEDVFRKYGEMDQFKLAKFSHSFPEWEKHKPVLDSGVSRVEMNYNDFFENPLSPIDDFFAEDQSQIQTAKDAFEESRMLENALN